MLVTARIKKSKKKLIVVVQIEKSELVRIKEKSPLRWTKLVRRSARKNKRYENKKKV
jgi:hypothetical protein